MLLAFLSGIGSGELILIVAVALIVLGPKRFPEIARKIGGVVRDLRRATNDLQRQVDDELRAVDVEVRDLVPKKGAWQSLTTDAAAPDTPPLDERVPIEVSAEPPNRATYGMAAGDVDAEDPLPRSSDAPSVDAPASDGADEGQPTQQVASVALDPGDDPSLMPEVPAPVEPEPKAPRDPSPKKGERT